MPTNNPSKNLFLWVKRPYLMENGNIHWDLIINNTTIICICFKPLHTKWILIMLALIFHYGIMWTPLESHQRRKREKRKWVSSKAGRTSLKATVSKKQEEEELHPELSPRPSGLLYFFLNKHQTRHLLPEWKPNSSWSAWRNMNPKTGQECRNRQRRKQ